MFRCNLHLGKQLAQGGNRECSEALLHVLFSGPHGRWPERQDCRSIFQCRELHFDDFDARGQGAAIDGDGVVGEGSGKLDTGFAGDFDGVEEDVGGGVAEF